MTNVTASRFRRIATGTSLIVFPLSMLGAALAQPVLGEEARQVYDAAVAHPGRIAASAAVGTPGVLLWIVAVAGTVHLVRERGAALAHVGAGLALLGTLGHMVMATLFLVLLGLPQTGDRTQLVPALDRIAGHVFPLAMPLLLLGAIGLVLLSIALRRAGQAPLATPLLVGFGFLSEFVPFGGTTGDVVLWALAGTGLALVGLRVLAMTDAQWQAPASAPTTPGQAAVTTEAIAAARTA